MTKILPTNLVSGYIPAVATGVLDVPSNLADISCPVLILQGTNDPLVSLQAPRFLSALPNARLRWLTGLSHIPISDDPQRSLGSCLTSSPKVDTSNRRVLTR